MSNNSWLHLTQENPRHALPQDLRARDPMGARDCGWVDQMLPFVHEFLPQSGDAPDVRPAQQQRGAQATGASWIIDPFCGFASTLVAASLAGRPALGIELSAQRASLARQRLTRLGLNATSHPVITGNLATPHTLSEVSQDAPPDGEPRRFTLCLTNVPYFGCTTSPDTAARAGNAQLYQQPYYETYLQGLRDVFVAVHKLLEPGGWCVAMVQNLSLGGHFVPLAWDLARLLSERFVMTDERILVYDKPAGTAPDLSVSGAFASGNRAHEYALICRKQPQPLDLEAAGRLLAELSGAGFAFEVYGSFAKWQQGHHDIAPNDVDLRVPHDEAAVARLMQWLEARGFRVESWNAPVHAPVAIEALAYRHYFRARRLSQNGLTLQIDIAIAQR